jgi:hypothetical protein
MAGKQLSAEPVIDAIDDLIAQLRRTKLPKTREYERTQALMTLEGVRQILQARCLTASCEFRFVSILGESR